MASSGFGFGFDGKSPQAVALGAILIFGVAYLLAQGLADSRPRGADAAHGADVGRGLGRLFSRCSAGR